ncbi:hypothetical protein [Bradyrhizobium sp.]|uniref:hypothetical protein n=1 Tax=Bradyrhizobium sp. TaxID=376 RepID=UPI002DFA48E8|nr:hypothetical protein [Bradyrhizobium sp.]
MTGKGRHEKNGAKKILAMTDEELKKRIGKLEAINQALLTNLVDLYGTLVALWTPGNLSKEDNEEISKKLKDTSKSLQAVMDTNTGKKSQ